MSVYFPKIQAIKAVREKTGIGLKDAKDAVEEAMRSYFSFDAVIDEACRIVNPYQAIQTIEPDYKKIWGALHDRVDYDTALTMDAVLKEEVDRLEGPSNLTKKFAEGVGSFVQDNAVTINHICSSKLVRELLVNTLIKILDEYSV